MSGPLTVAQAQAALDAAMARAAELRGLLKEADLACDVAREDLHAAMVRADAELPRATLVETSWRGTNPTAHEVVIVKRTDKSITVRFAGRDHGYTFRRSANGVWRQYPAPKGMSDTTRTLEVPA